MQTPEEKSEDTSIAYDKQEQPSQLPGAWRHFLETVQRHYDEQQKE
ncbi:hypothetical protein [Brevibacillus sp. NRS-1366]